MIMNICVGAPDEVKEDVGGAFSSIASLLRMIFVGTEVEMEGECKFSHCLSTGRGRVCVCACVLFLRANPGQSDEW